MAKKKQALTPEERLQAALVPESEQPYKIPENWCWTRLGNITKVIGGGTPSSKVTAYYENGNIPWLSPADLSGYNEIYISHGAKNITELGLEKSSAKMMPANTVCLSSRAPIGYVAIAQNPLSTNQGFKSFLPSPCYVPKYLYWYLKGNKELLESYASGTTFLELSGGKAGLVEIPLSPLSEQQRIVDRIESLFAKLDEAKQKAQNALDSFETRKAAILHKAFNGELTAQWRKEHGVGMESWKKVKFGELGTLERGRSKHRPRNDPKLFGGSYPFIQTGDIANAGMYITEHKKNLSDFGKEQSRVFPKGTLCITIAANIGDVAILSYDCCFPDSVVGFTPNQLSNSEFMYYMLGTLKDELEANAPATAQKNINLKVLNNLIIIVPIISEQLEIVRILDDLFAKEQQAKEAAESVLNQIDLIKKSILARAFRGELGTNDPSEENAVELLKEIISKKE